MSGIIVGAVTRAIRFEVEQGQLSKLALDRLWMWRVCDYRVHEDWCPQVNKAYTNHFLTAHRENTRYWLHAVWKTKWRCWSARGSMAGEAPVGATPAIDLAAHVAASNTTPIIPNLGIWEGSGGK